MDQRPAASGAAGWPERVGRYQVLSPIARGGMATVYLARAVGPRGFEQRVALKLVHAHLRDDEHFATDIIEEAKLAVCIRHPNVVTTLDAGEDEAGVFLVMEYVEGDSLGGLLRAAHRARLRVPRAVGLRILCDALEGLHAAHELRDAEGRPNGLVHRDFSPHNILVGVDGVSRLADFGVAKAASRTTQTQTGAVKGKIAYMAPEQARGAPLDRRCDVWAAGVVGWELCAERRLYPSSDVSTLFDIVSRPPPRLSSVDADAPAALVEAIARALAMEPRHRWPTAAAFAEALRGAGVEIAGAAEVADLVREIAAPAIAARRQRIADALSAPRARRSESDRAPPPSGEPVRNDRRRARARTIGSAAAGLTVAVAAVVLLAGAQTTEPSPVVPEQALAPAAAPAEPSATPMPPEPSANQASSEPETPPIASVPAKPRPASGKSRDRPLARSPYEHTP